ncbi:MAG: YdeI/OmpD-associated family protein [Candidatus Pacebacteria bacterium]|nr:YdeI/OmpD-associated family protein [Candidatus Paceibacterota bacterium]
MSIETVATICPTSREEWRDWLAAHHQTEDAIWLVYFKKSSGKPSLSWSDAVSEALCFGWIDSVKKTIDQDSYRQYFCKRKATSGWSRINKDKVAELQAAGLMAAAGLASVERAKENGSWTHLDSVEAMVIPDDLAAEFLLHPTAKTVFAKMSKTNQKQHLYRLHHLTGSKRTAYLAKMMGELMGGG